MGSDPGKERSRFRARRGSSQPSCPASFSPRSNRPTELPVGGQRTGIVGSLCRCRYLSFVGVCRDCRDFNSDKTALRAFRAVSRETPYFGARFFSIMFSNSNGVSCPCWMSFLMAVLTRSNFSGFTPRRRPGRLVFAALGCSTRLAAADFRAPAGLWLLLAFQLRHFGWALAPWRRTKLS